EEDVSIELGNTDHEKTTADNNKPLALVIDDNDDIRSMVSTLLSDTYNVIQAADGSDGLRAAAKYIPDIVVSDVMMPGMDGLEFCRRLKGEISTSHIPVLLLTACSLDEQRAQGYRSGADGYVSKPFSAEVLLSRCESLIENRRRIHNLYSESMVAPAPKGADPKAALEADTPIRGDLDNEFYNRFLSEVHKNLSDSELSVDSIAAALGLGRSQLYRKIKALTNYSPVELLRNIRLKEARHLLTTTSLSVSEIAYQVGFSTPTYFTKCYREAFGETPTDLRDKISGKV
ncbi:MAG: helix-turn-helix domain-containing protein, partial [Muribaculaceae bacterium]|nr:helix-turn-helix domain-containing protein [Muribaculaceae bacterium]